MTRLRTGWNQYEDALNVQNVSGSQFGLLMNLPVDGNVYAEPLYIRALSPSAIARNELIVATENDSVYAFDADRGTLIWKRNFTDPANGLTAMPARTVSCHNVWPTVGITGTPVVERSLNTVYLVDKLKQTSGSTFTIRQELRALSLTTGADVGNSPQTIAAHVQMSNGDTLYFDSQWALQRAGLLASNAKIYIGFGTHCDNNHEESHGWVLAYNEKTLDQVAAFSTTTDPADSYIAGVWMAGFGLASDVNGSVYFSVGNGPINADEGGHNFGESVLKLSPTLGVQDFFAPHNARVLKDKEIGSGGVMLLPDQTGPFPHLAVVAGKNRTLYLLNRDFLGGFHPDGLDNIVQEIPNAIGAPWIGVHGGPAYYGGSGGQLIFFAPHQDHLKAFRLLPFPATPLTLVDQSQDIFSGEGGSIPFVSSRGTKSSTAIVWAIMRPDEPDQQPLRLVAYKAVDVRVKLVDMPAGPWFNPEGNADITPTVANGKVYVPSANSVAVFGLHP